MKIFQILPHCSTGGMPQYALKMVQSLENEHDVKVIETDYVSADFIVQRTQFKNFVSLQGNHSLLLDYIEKEKPDVLHFQEIPETFMNAEVLAKIYRPDRPYFIIFSAHGMNRGRHEVRHLPDKIVAVSNWQKAKFEREFPEVPIDKWEYPIENLKPSPEERENARRKLGFPLMFPEAKKHILNVGLFTPYKNQGELFDIARKNPDNIYHFVGNQAGNPDFKAYWEPLMRNKPDNCIVWGERSDTDLFYKACDEVYFMSTWELYPIAIREALSYGLPIHMYRLETYLDDYDNHPLVTFFDKKKKEEPKKEDEQPTYIATGQLSQKSKFIINGLMEIIHKARRKENNRGNQAFSKELRDDCKKLGIIIKDKPDGTSDWELK